MYIGQKVKELRRAKGMSLSELSEKSKVQIATLSRIEHMKMVGTLESHLNIAKALGVDVTQLYSGIIREETPSGPQKPKTAKDIFLHSDKSSYEVLTSQILSKKMMPVLLKIEPGGKTAKEQNQTGSEKFVFVLEGSVEVKISSDTYPLSKHNTLYFDAALEHSIANKGKSPARVLSVVTPVSL